MEIDIEVRSMSQISEMDMVSKDELREGRREGARGGRAGGEVSFQGVRNGSGR